MSFVYRTDAAIIFILVTDVGYHTPTSYETIVTETGGSWFSSGSSSSTIIDTIGTSITEFGDYMITYLADDFTANKSHTVRVAVHTRGGDAQATATFTSPSVVNYTRAKQMLLENNAAHAKK